MKMSQPDMPAADLPSTDPNAPEARFSAAVVSLVRGFRKRFDARAASIGMTFSRAQALTAVSRNEGMTQTALADELDVEAPSLNRTLDWLEKSGLIERRSVPEDRRIRQVYLTPAAHERAATVLSFTAELRHELYHDISAEELAETLAVLERISRNLDKMGS